MIVNKYLPLLALSAHGILLLTENAKVNYKSKEARRERKTRAYQFKFGNVVEHSQFKLIKFLMKHNPIFDGSISGLL